MSLKVAASEVHTKKTNLPKEVLIYLLKQRFNSVEEGWPADVQPDSLFNIRSSM